MTLRRILLIAAVGVAGALPALGQEAQDAGDPVSVERQLRLKRRLLMGSESLLATLRSNVQQWRDLTPEQREQLRHRAYALRQATPAQQQRLIEAYAKYLRLSAVQRAEYRRRAERIEQVLDLLSDDEKQRLLELPAHQRAVRIMEMRRAFQAEGRIPADEPEASPTNDDAEQPEPPAEPATEADTDANDAPANEQPDDSDDAPAQTPQP
jgi:hypothetical protein